MDLGLDASEFIPDSDEVTDLATIISQPSGTSVTILNATVTAVNTRGYVISDGTNHIYVYKGSDAKLAIGDKVSIIGTFQYYWGEYEISSPSEKKTGTATAIYPETPLDLQLLKNQQDSKVSTAASGSPSMPRLPLQFTRTEIILSSWLRVTMATSLL